MQSNELILSLIEQTRQIINKVERLKQYNRTQLTWRKEDSSWNILECVEHLNLYGDFYMPAIEKAIQQSDSKPEVIVRPGWLGNYFAKSMLPKEQLNKMKTFKDKNPLNASLDESVFIRFHDQQIRLIELLNKSKEVSLNKVRVPISIAPFIKIRLGDTFRFYINHMLRHMVQVEKIEGML